MLAEIPVTIGQTGWIAQAFVKLSNKSYTIFLAFILFYFLNRPICLSTWVARRRFFDHVFQSYASDLADMTRIQSMIVQCCRRVLRSRNHGTSESRNLDTLEIIYVGFIIVGMISDEDINAAEPCQRWYNFGVRSCREIPIGGRRC